MKNLERIIFYVILAAAIVTMGALIYEKVNDDTVDLLNKHIANLQLDNYWLVKGLDDIGARIITVQDTLTEFEQENSRLKGLLTRSSEIAGSAEEENRAITAGIGRALAIVRRLKADCQRE